MRRAGLTTAVAVIVALAAGCWPGMMRSAPSPIRAGLNPVEVLDLPAESDTSPAPDLAALARIAPFAQARLPANVPRRSVLVLSGGGSYGAYSAGVLVGWTQTCARPEFDVVTGISTGALIAPLAFLGPEYDSTLRVMYTTISNKDLFRIKLSLRALLLSESLADNDPLARKIEEMVTPELLRRIAGEHARGRRLYVGTTDLESRRAVVWDMGAIATRGTAADVRLFRRVLLGSAAIPGIFPPVRIPVEVDGRTFEERHVDGGVTQALFFRPPYIPPEQRRHPDRDCLRGSDVYVIVAGKLYADPEVVRPRSLIIAVDSVSTVLYAQTRSELHRLYTGCVLGGMNYHQAAIPATYQNLPSSTNFEPTAMSRLFDEGVRQAVQGTAWRSNPPDTGPGEGAFTRSGSMLSRVPLGLPMVRKRAPAILPWRSDRGVPRRSGDTDATGCL